MPESGDRNCHDGGRADCPPPVPTASDGSGGRRGNLSRLKWYPGPVPVPQPPCPGDPGMQRAGLEPRFGQKLDAAGDHPPVSGGGSALYLHEGRHHTLRPCDTLEADEWITRERKAYFAALILDTLAGGPATREMLREICRGRGLTEQEEESVFNPWGGAIRALAEAGKLVHLVQEEKAFRLAPPFEPMGEAAAWREILRRYFTHCGPATLRDAAYFLGLSQRELKRQMQDLDLREICLLYTSDNRWVAANSTPRRAVPSGFGAAPDHRRSPLAGCPHPGAEVGNVNGIICKQAYCQIA